MNKIRRTFIITLFFVLAAMLVYGFYLVESKDVETLKRGHKFIGVALAGGMFVLMPTFIYHRWKDRKVKDYMLTDESFQRIKDYNNSKDKKKQDVE